MVQFTKLKLSGFKSFLHPTEIDIGRGKTGIAGPNGCGKSNLLEALGWVMGETSAKRMRGGAMDDVIFNGTNNKAARTTAEVTVYLDNSDKSAPPPYRDMEELEVTRRIERGSGSDYLINGKSVRAKDVQLLFADLVSGANSPALVSQGRITGIIQAKPKDRRKILEDAAGISGLHARRHEAELKLRATQNNLDRLDDVIGTLETQFSSLQKQARQAKRYRTISDTIKEQEATVLHIKWSLIEAGRKQAKDGFNSVETKIRDLLSETTSLNTKRTEIFSTIPDLRKNEAERSAAYQRLLIEKESYDKKRAENSAQIQQLEQDIESLGQDQTRFDDRLNQAQQTLAEKQDLLNSANESDQINEADQEQAIINKRSHAQTQLETLETQRQTLVQEMATARAQRNSLTNQKIGLEGQIASLNGDKKKYEERLETVTFKIKEQTLFDSLKKDIETGEDTLKARETAMNALDDKRLEADIEISNARAQLQTVQARETKTEAEINALTEILNANTSNDDQQPVLDMITVKDGYEKALAHALGDALDNPILEEALIFWSDLGTKNLSQKLPDTVKPLSDFVDAPSVLSRALSQIGVAQTKEQATSALQDLHPGQIIVTKDGDYWRWDGLTARADAPSNAAIKLEQRNRLSDLKTTLVTCVKDTRKEQTILDKALNTQEQTVSKAKELRTALRDLQDEQKQRRSRLGSLEREMTELSQTESSLKASLARIDETVAQTRTQLETVKQNLSTIEQGDNKDAQSETLNKDIDTQRNIIRDLNEQIQELRLEKERRISLERQLSFEIKTLEDTVRQAQEQLTSIKPRLETLETRLNVLRQTPDEDQARLQDMLDALEKTETMRNDANALLQTQESAIHKLDADIRVYESKMADMREERAHLNANLKNIEERLTDLRETVLNKFEMEPAHLLERLDLKINETSALILEKAESRHQRLLRERETMGAVNLRAEIEADEVEQEIDRLTKEQYELSTAINKLRHAIGRLNSEARERLMKAFGEVDAHFRKLFERLFGGGKAYLQLTEADDPLDAGLEIYAQPPGKKLQNLTLLSGGEQTLTSIALVFAMFLTNPSPICVLDEIDAALDDANVDRVFSLLDDMARKGDTRFLVISHHRMSIARMDRLYGVTMAERGISQLVSVDLSQADLWQDAA